MEKNLIRPIPKYIIARIQKMDKKECPAQKGAARLYSYLTKIRGEIVKITVAVKTHRKKQYFKQVAAHGAKSDMCYVKDFEYNYVGMGYRVGWYAEGLQKYAKWFEYTNWCSAESKYYNAWTTTVNPEFIAKFPEYRYSAYRQFNGRCVIEYLKLYTKYPQVEYLIKLGLLKLHDSITVLKRIAKDKVFCRWLIAHKEEINAEWCYIGSVLESYKTGKPIKRVQEINAFKKRLINDESLSPIKELFGNNLERFFLYLEETGASPQSYRDYLKACNYLGLDMSLPKNRFPRDFKHWHNIRIDQFATAKALADEQERAELYKRFAAVAEKYRTLQKHKGGSGRAAGFAVMIATSPKDLIREGEVLNHCVGKMNYDSRMAREEALIFFVRSTAAPDTPFVTLEYSPKDKRVLQCYGKGNQKPDESVLHYIHKVWQPYANRNLKKLIAAA